MRLNGEGIKLKMKLQGSVYVFVCYVMYGLFPVFWKQLATVNSFYVLAVRVVWSLLILLGILVVCRELDSVRVVLKDRKKLGILALASGFLCLNWGSYIWAVNSGRGVDASLAYYIAPILSILLGNMVFRERLTKLQWFSIAVTFVGLVVTVVRSGQMPWVALIIGGSFVIYSALKKEIRVKSNVSMFFETLYLAPFALVLMVWLDQQGNGAVGVLRGWQWLLLPAAGMITVIPLLLFSKGIQDTSMSLAGILMYINPTLQLMISVWLYHEEFTTTHAILFGFVGVGVMIYLVASLLERRRKEYNRCE